MSLATHMDHPHVEGTAEDEPVRIFKSDLLEQFTHIHPAWVPLIWLPIAVAILYWNANQYANAQWRILIGLPAGMGLVWTFIEYFMHRFVFHFKPRNPFQERALFILHEVHHVQPNCKTRLVIAPPLSISIAALFYLAFTVAIGGFFYAPEWVLPLFAGTLIGYVCYDMTHYALHHSRSNNRIFKALKRHHLLHHFEDSNARYGVTSPVWDYVMGTQKGKFWGRGR